MSCQKIRFTHPSRYDAVDKVLRAIAVYRKKDPEDAEEEVCNGSVCVCVCVI